MTRIREKHCRHCHSIFFPDYRNAKKQRFCSKAECRTASKAESQRRWSKKNPDYFKGSDNVERVREWRRAHPGYRRKTSGSALQDHCPQESSKKQDVNQQLPSVQGTSPPVLQDVCLDQQLVIVGLISYLTGCVLQDDIVASTRRLQQLGQDVLSGSIITKGGNYDLQVSHLSGPHPHHSRTVQLGGSPAGP